MGTKHLALDRFFEKWKCETTEKCVVKKIPDTTAKLFRIKKVRWAPVLIRKESSYKSLLPLKLFQYSKRI